MEDLNGFAPYIDAIRKLPFVVSAELRDPQRRQPADRPDALLKIRTTNATYDFDVYLRAAPMSEPIIEALLARTKRKMQGPGILFTPHVSLKASRRLGAQGLNYVDLAGNSRLRLGADHTVIVEGQPARRKPERGRGLGASGHQVLFALLASPKLANSPVRVLAAAAGASKTVAAHVLARLQQEGLLGGRRGHRQLLNRELIMQRWLTGYSSLVRPRLFVGSYRAQDSDPGMLQERIEGELANQVTWAWGGGAAAMRLTGYYRGETTVLHIDRPPGDLTRRLHVLPADTGDLTILRAPGPLAFEGHMPRTVHPLLVYTELLNTLNERARDAAEEIRIRFLEPQQ